MARENAKVQAAQKELEYRRDLEAKDKQYAHEMKKTGLLNQGRLDAEAARNAGANARLDRRIAADKDKIGLLGQNRLDVEAARNAGANARLEKRLAADKANASSKGESANNEDLYVTLKDQVPCT